MKDRKKEEACEKASSAQDMVKGQTNPWIFWVPDKEDIQACQQATQPPAKKKKMAKK